jgi:PHP family Zn ribbon phosphoesterase
MGTVEYYPEEGKYYADGHRNCNLSLLPEETERCSGICPVCGKQVTIGVLNRIKALSDKEKYKESTQVCLKTIPLLEILSEIFQLNPGSKKLMHCYNTLLKQFGPEIDILTATGIGEIRNSGVPLLAEAIERIRKNEVMITPGFDGKYGTVEIFKKEEINGLKVMPKGLSGI